VARFLGRSVGVGPLAFIRYARCALRAGIVFAGFAAVPASAQRAGDNALTAAQDAFGTTVGNESIGLYTTGSARGFSPVQAGNVRLEGLYFYQGSTPGSTNGLDSHLSRGSTVRVGLTAQSYPFPAPTGIADYRLRLPGDKTIVSVVANYGPYETYKADVDAEVPVIPGKLGVVLGVGGGYDSYTWGGDTTSWSAAGLVHWRPRENLEIIPFWSRSARYNWESVAFVATGGDWLPPKIKDRAQLSKTWTDTDTTDLNFGMLARLVAGPHWTLRAGVFRSKNGRPERIDALYLDTQRDGTTQFYAAADVPLDSGAYSGEVRASGTFTEGPRRHTVHLATRGYTSARNASVADTRFIGQTIIGVQEQFPEPVFNLRSGGVQKSRQGTVGVAYEGGWAGIGELSAGIQKTFYERTFMRPGLPDTGSQSRPWLYNGTLALFATRDLTVYGSYTRGLEESSIAPESAANRGNTLPANITEQIDAGVRYVITPGLRFVGGVFEVKKPYLDRDAANVFTSVGSVTHRGIELSLSGQPLEGLTVVAGAVLLRARVSGFTVDQGVIGKIPAGSTPRLLRLNLQYGPKTWDGLSVETQIEHKSAQYANRRNTFKRAASTTVNIGGRYQFNLFDSPASLRVQVLNLTNDVNWTVSGASGFFMAGDTRRYTARLAVDF